MKSSKKILALFLAFVFVLSTTPLMTLSATEILQNIDQSNLDELPEGYVDNSNEDMFQLQEAYENQQSMRRFMSASSTTDKKVEIAFLIDASGSMASYIAKVKENITAFAQYFESEGIDLRMAVIRFGSMADGNRATMLKINGSSWHTSTAQLVQTLSNIPADGGTEALSDAIGDMLHNDPATNLPNIYWSSDAYKFAFVLTNDFDTGVQGLQYNDYGYPTLDSTIPDLQSSRIPVTVVTSRSYYSRYNNLATETGGELYDIASANYSELLINYANNVLGIALKSSKAIYVLPGYLGSELYAGADGTTGGEKLWLDGIGWNLDTVLYQSNLKKFYQDEYGNGTELHVDYERDDYGVAIPFKGDTYQKLVTKLRDRFNGTYDVVFFPYNWLEDLNDSTTKLENHIKKNGYTDVVFVTHSTGGLLASSYIARSDTNKRKVEKAILIAAPLFGTYASLFPIERGDSRKATKGGLSDFFTDMMSSNSWIRGWAKNSSTSYQLLPSKEYLAHYPLWDMKGWGDGENKDITSMDDFYNVLNQSNNINPYLTNNPEKKNNPKLSTGVERSHKYFRETTLNGDVVNQWAIASLMEVDTLLIGCESGYDTPSIAVYKEPLIGTNRTLKDIQYNTKGDGTVQGISAKALSKNTGQILEYENFTGADHGGLVENDNVLNRICSKIADNGGGGGGFRMAAAPFSVDVGMSDRIKIRYSCDKPIAAIIYNGSGDIVAQANGDDYFGFELEGFIYDNFTDDFQTTEASIYMPNQGYKIEFSYGIASGTTLEFSYEVSTLVTDGWKDISVSDTANVTVENGIIAVLDGTIQPILSSNIASNINGEVTIHYTDWDLPSITKVNLNDVIKVEPMGAQSAQVASSLRWNTSDDSIVEIGADGTITAKGYGRAIISANNGSKSSTSEVIVAQNASTVALTDIEMIIGERTLIRPQFAPTTATEIDMSYNLSANDIVEINEYGVIHALATGTVTVTGSTTYGVQDSFVVTVVDNTVYAVQSIDISPSATSIAIGSSVTLNVVIAPENATNKNVNWLVVDEGVISLSSTSGKAVITGLKEGSTKVTAVSVDGGYTAEATITVTKNQPYTITIIAIAGIGGTVFGGGTFSSGTQVTLTATPYSGYSFDGWYENNSKITGNTTYSFPATTNRTLESRFTQNSGGYIPPSDNGTSGGSTSPNNSTSPDTSTNNYVSSPTPVEKPVVKINGVSIDYTFDAKGNVVLTPTQAQMKKITDNAKDGVLTIDINTLTGVSSISLDFNMAWIPKNIKSMKVFDKTFGSFEIKYMTLAKYNGKITLVLKKGSLITDILVDSKSVYVTDYANPMIVSMPYTLKSGELANQVVMVNKKTGKVIPRSYYKDGSVYATVYSTGYFEVAHIEPKTFTDTQGTWSDQYVKYMNAHGVINGITETTFEPDTKVTRAQYITMLIRLLDLTGVDYSDTEAFLDVDKKDPYYSAIMQAKTLGITNGIGSNKFGKELTITLEDMYTMTYRAMKQFGMVQDFDKTKGLDNYTDGYKVSSYAVEAIQNLLQNGIVKSEGNLNPKVTASRAITALMMYRLLLSEK